MESSLKHAGWNKRADWNFTQKTINVQDLIRVCRMILQSSSNMVRVPHAFSLPFITQLSTEIVDPRKVEEDK